MVSIEHIIKILEHCITNQVDVLTVKINFGLLLSIFAEVDLFKIPYLDNAFLQGLAMERKVVPGSRCPQA